MLQLIPNSRDKIKFLQSENSLLPLGCFLRFVPSGETLDAALWKAAKYVHQSMFCRKYKEQPSAKLLDKEK